MVDVVLGLGITCGSGVIVPLMKPKTLWTCIYGMICAFQSKKLSQMSFMVIMLWGLMNEGKEDEFVFDVFAEIVI